MLTMEYGSSNRLRSVMLDFKVFDCLICDEPLTVPIFQCDNGHLVCSLCCPKLKNKCPVCTLPIGFKRCRAMENVLEAIFVPCPNATLGCTKTISYGKISTHKKECAFTLCNCPEQDCNYTCSYKGLYYHYSIAHLSQSYNQDMFCCDIPFCVRMNINDKISIQRECEKGLLFVVQCFRKPYGVFVTVSCIAPFSPEVEKFSYRISYTVGGHTVTYESTEVKTVCKVSFQTPKDNFMLIHQSLLRGELLEMELCIKTLNQE